VDGAVSTIIQKIAEQGLLGILFLGVAYALYHRDKALMTALAAKADDVKELTKALLAATDVMRAVTTAQERAAEGSHELAETIRRDITGLLQQFIKNLENRDRS
jgi:hypothetical protein